MNYGQAKAKNSLRPKFKSQSQIDIWDVDTAGIVYKGWLEKSDNREK
jgi:hypothetical protein